MDRASAVRQLPVLHGVAVRLQEAGCDDHVIAVAVGIEESEVPVLLRLATSKLVNLMAGDGTADSCREFPRLD